MTDHKCSTCTESHETEADASECCRCWCCGNKLDETGYCFSCNDPWNQYRNEFEYDEGD